MILAEATDRAEIANRATGIRISSGVFLLFLCLLSAAGLFLYLRARKAGNTRKAASWLYYLTYGTLAFQAVHTIEHMVQAGYWVRFPNNNPWLSPWADAATRGLAALGDPNARVQTGAELLHLGGNAVFFFGLVAMYIALRDAGARGNGMWGASGALILEGIHFGEHIVLTSTWYVIGKPYGLSVLFGWGYTLPAPWPPAIRIWWHFMFNLMPMVCAFVALKEMYNFKIFKVLDEGQEDAEAADADDASDAGAKPSEPEPAPAH